jgi:hypothetical protein
LNLGAWIVLAKPFDPEEAILLATLAGSEAESKVDQRRRCSAIGRKLRMLRAHGLIRKVPRTYRYQAEEGSSLRNRRLDLGDGR